MFELDRPYRKKKPDVLQRRCHRCHGSGSMTCTCCGGRGKITASRNPLGGAIDARCTACYGNKRSRCRTCQGTGFTT